MTTIEKVLEAVLALPWEDQESLIQAVQQHQAELRRSELAEYSQQMKLDVQAGKLCPRSVTEIMSQLDEPQVAAE